jgi:hypothetical protein
MGSGDWSYDFTGGERAAEGVADLSVDRQILQEIVSKKL